VTDVVDYNIQDLVNMGMKFGYSEQKDENTNFKNILLGEQELQKAAGWRTYNNSFNDGNHKKKTKPNGQTWNLILENWVDDISESSQAYNSLNSTEAVKAYLPKNHVARLYPPDLKGWLMFSSDVWLETTQNLVQDELYMWMEVGAFSSPNLDVRVALRRGQVTSGSRPVPPASRIRSARP